MLELFGKFKSYLFKLAALLPLIAKLDEAKTPEAVAAVIVDALQELAKQSDIKLDDDVLELVEAAVKCPEVVAATKKLLANLAD